MATPPFELTTIGELRTPFAEKVEAPRQASAAKDVPGTVNVYPEYEHALADLEGIDRLWILYLFHLNDGGWRSKVLPPRSEKRRGVFATRSPHRPNPIGLSCVRLIKVEGLTLSIEGVDMIDRTPVIDIKPYIPYADAFPDAQTGWLDPSGVKDPIEPFDVRWSNEATAQVEWLAAHGVDLGPAVARVLALGPQPHPYRRIRKDGDSMRLALKDWRVRFRSDDPARVIVVLSVATGYRARQIADAAADSPLDVHRAFVERFG